MPFGLPHRTPVYTTAEIRRIEALAAALPERPQLMERAGLADHANVFFLRGVPILSAFTGSHSEYHTPRDTPSTMNYDGAAKVARFMGLVARSLATRDAPPDYVPQAGPKPGERRAGLRGHPVHQSSRSAFQRSVVPPNGAGQGQVGVAPAAFGDGVDVFGCEEAEGELVLRAITG